MGFRARNSSPSGYKVLKARRAKGRKLQKRREEIEVIPSRNWYYADIY